MVFNNDKYITSSSFKDYSLWKKLNGRRLPISIDLEITARCNNNCRHCYINLPANNKSAKKREMPLGEIEKIADQAVSMGSLWCLITGGEPLLREDFFDIYMMLKSKGLLVSVFTNGCLINEDHISLFKKLPPRDIEISVYGATKDTYERVTRCQGSFLSFNRGLNLLIDNDVKVRLKAVIMRSNIHELSSIADFCREKTIDFYRFDPFLHLRTDGNKKRNQEIKNERLLPEEIVSLEKNDPERFQYLCENFDQFIFDDIQDNSCNHILRCGAGNMGFYVSHDGMFRLCSSLCHPKCVYNLVKGNLKEAWNEFVPHVREITSNRGTYLQTCAKCRIVNLCMWCPAHAYLETGQLDESVDYFCEVAHKREEMLDSLKNV